MRKEVEIIKNHFRNEDGTRRSPRANKTMDTETTKRTRLETQRRHSWGKRQRRPNTWATGAVRRCEENQSKGRDREKTTVLENFLEIKKKKKRKDLHLLI